MSSPLMAEAKPLKLILAHHLRPTQASMGALAMEEKLKKLKSLNDFDRAQYLKDQAVPAVLGPSSTLYMLDRHHTTRAMHELHGEKAQVYYYVAGNLSHHTEDVFLQKMIEAEYLNLFDPNGSPIEPKDLPQTVMGLKDDPYRSLAYFVRRVHGFNKSKKPFAEFLWAGFFRKHIQLIQHEDPIKKEILDQAVALAHSHHAKHLPGYMGPL